MFADELKATEQTPRLVAADRCHRVDCFLYAQLINIESFSFLARNLSSRELLCIKYQ
jgi:hypothetical protein